MSAKVESQSEVEANPMRKIISMLQDMAKEIEREGEVEKELFDKALCACEGGEKEVQNTIDESTAAIDEFGSKVQSDGAQKAQLSQEVSEAQTAAADATKDLETATELRAKDHKAFVAKETSTKQNIAALGKAIPAIEQGMGGASLMQVQGLPKLNRFLEVTNLMTAQERTSVLSFLDQGSESASGASGEILGILKNLLDSMQADLAESQESEQKDLEAYNELKEAKEKEIRVTNMAVIEKGKRIGTLEVSLSEGEHALKDAKEELENAQNFKANMKEECASKMKDRDERAKMRKAEVSAISEAVGILNDDDALEVFSKTKSAALVQKPRQLFEALLQLTHGSSIKRRSFLTMKAKTPEVPEGFGETKSAAPPPNTPPPTPRPIQLGAALVCDDDGDCKDLRTEGTEAEKLVTGMVDGMVSVLHDEDVGDEHKKEWCFNETNTVHNLYEEKKDLIAKAKSDITEQQDHIARLTAMITDTKAKISELDKLVHETTEQRKKEHQEFVDAYATSATAIRLIDKAVLKLERFYSPEKVAKKEAAVKAAAMKKAGLSLVHTGAKPNRMLNVLLPGGDLDFLQLHQRTMQIPETPSGTYEKAESGGVMGLMNDFLNDLKTDMTESETEEKFAAKEYVRIMTDSQESRKADVRSVNEKKSAKAAVDEKMVANKELLTLAEEEFHNLELYKVQLETECGFLMRNFENRHEGRIDSEVGLTGAETIVSGGSPPNHAAIESRFDDESSDEHVDTNFPGTPVSDVQPMTPPPAPKKTLTR